MKNLALIQANDRKITIAINSSLNTNVEFTTLGGTPLKFSVIGPTEDVIKAHELLMLAKNLTETNRETYPDEDETVVFYTRPMTIGEIKKEIFDKKDEYCVGKAEELFKAGTADPLDLSTAKWDVLRRYKRYSTTLRHGADLLCGFCFKSSLLSGRTECSLLSGRTKCSRCPVKPIFGDQCEDMPDFTPSEIYDKIKGLCDELRNEAKK